MSVVSISQDPRDIGRAIESSLARLPLSKLVRGKLVAVSDPRHGGSAGAF